MLLQATGGHDSKDLRQYFYFPQLASRCLKIHILLNQNKPFNNLNYLDKQQQPPTNPKLVYEKREDRALAAAAAASSRVLSLRSFRIAFEASHCL